MFFHKKRATVFSREGFVPAGGLVAYVGIVAIVLSHGNDWFRGIPPYAAIVLMLSLLSFSVLVCALIVLSGPYQLFVAKKGKEALALVVSTAAWLAMFVALIIVVVLFGRWL